jgi:nucleoside-diphosphate-sugar epimerase
MYALRWTRRRRPGFALLVVSIAATCWQFRSAQAEPARKVAVVIGDTGDIGSHAASSLADHGYEVVGVSSSAAIGDRELARHLARKGVTHQAHDVYAPAAQRALQTLFERADVVVNAAEPYAFGDGSPQGDRAALDGVRTLYTTLARAGYTKRSGKTVIRIGSPVELGTFDDPDIDATSKERARRGGFEEDLAPPRGQSEGLAYHRLKRATGTLMDELAAEHDLAFVSLHPSAVIGTLAARHKTLIEAYNEAESGRMATTGSMARAVATVWDVASLGVTRKIRQSVVGERNEAVLQGARPVSALPIDVVPGEFVGDAIARAAKAAANRKTRAGVLGQRFNIGGASWTAREMLVHQYAQPGSPEIPDLRVFGKYPRSDARARRYQAASDERDLGKLRAFVSAEQITQAKLAARLSAEIGPQRSSTKAATMLGYRPPGAENLRQAAAGQQRLLRRQGRLGRRR